MLTPRDLLNVGLANATMVHTSLRRNATMRIDSHGTRAAPGMSPRIQEWLTQTLLRHTDIPPRQDGHPPIIWLHPPMDTAQRLFLYTPLDIGDPQSGWIGLEVAGVDAAVNPANLGGSTYSLFDERNRPVMHSPGAPMFEGEVTDQREDSFRLLGDGWPPTHLALSKQVGEDGWRLVYYTSLRQVLRDHAATLKTAAVVTTLILALVLLRIRYIRRHMVQPALRQYEALTDSVSLNRKLIEVAPVGLCLLRRSDGTLVMSNEMARHWFQDTPGWRAEILAHQGEKAGREYTLDDGRSAYLTFAPTTYQGEDVVLCGISDISELKKFERSLLQAKYDAEAANHAKTVFLTTMSHEIRTPLYGILGTLELFSLTKVNGQQEQYLETIQQSSSTLLRTVNDTLDLSRIEAGHVALEEAPFSAVELLNNVAASYAARAHGKGLRTYAISDPATPAALHGDSTRIRQILDNLMSNAIKFTEAGQIVLRLRLIRRERGLSTLAFQVADTGSGIAPQHQARLFEPYYQVDTDKNVRLPGTGLGLSICSRLSDMMGGSLTAVSELGLGTSITFEITLPTAEDPAEAPVSLSGNAMIYVQSSVPEIVSNLCGWLRRWGAAAVPYPPAGSPRVDAAVLLRAWPYAPEPAHWTGPTVITHPPGMKPRVEDGRRTWFASCYSLSNIAHALRLALGRSAHVTSYGQPAKHELVDLRVLVVEDNPISQLILREQLEHLGCTVVTASNGQEALALPDALSFDSVLTDLNMPLVDGYELTRILRERGYQQPILGITANAFPTNNAGA